MDISFHLFQTWIESLPDDTVFDYGSPVFSLEARFLASLVGKNMSVYIPPIGRGLVHSGHVDIVWPDDHWFSQLARFSYGNRVKTLAQAKGFLGFAARKDIR